MKKAFGYVLVLLIATGISGCQERASDKLPDEATKSQEVIAQSPSLAVSHSIEGNTVFLTFLTQNFMYAPEGQSEIEPGEGYVNVWVDNKLTRAYNNTLEVPNLTPGPHSFAVELVRNNHKPYPNTKISFTIQIK
ncbi:DUF6130 family protein [Aneurinibacillus aneurinilyticus]|jgi:hypothetical protein|uniref:DUF4399 domain-containing protein n=2 Tax=Aneurinibacillus aneurinilyticus TaxID=1391 RepID=A0A848CMF9_ANEAE|nr:DUF6130 family protein [Aneurinibacillus aneurinilyticus]ERI05609.1 hypothetical protein HMPREF0083_05604 [Aneurinibacillus aneurinilyticus ATCC 12856]MCI1696076.1 DUF6130 family protein [Aneurinibacillus aneurinilyticus]MED0672827.1 DUF6130 family protein [Aneurinibacillus aneurinilyticus]MED0706240.1 DUF6130 family protein [Aneurinibacillus aneurinilyticus]MED0724194.1 DUF6130 family protein [Aneurinibacillus aneurinilyticus]